MDVSYLPWSSILVSMGKQSSVELDRAWGENYSDAWILVISMDIWIELGDICSWLGPGTTKYHTCFPFPPHFGSLNPDLPTCSAP